MIFYYTAIYYWKKTHINFIYSVDRIMDFNRAEPTCYRTKFHNASTDQQNETFSYKVLRLTYIRGLVLELSRSFPIAQPRYVTFVRGSKHWKLNSQILRTNANIRNRSNQVPPWPGTPYGKVTKTQENITHKRAKRSALSYLLIKRMQGTDKTVLQRQTRTTNNKKGSTREAPPWNGQ